jgi:hypothetical protein
MAHLPFAFSVHHFINSVGADAGFASIIGLAILVLLYFAQARETATLRDRADEADEHARQLELRLQNLARQAPQGVQAAPAPIPRPSPARPLVNPPATATAGTASATVPPAAAPATAGSAAAIPAAPAGVGAPALTAATKLIPTPAAAAAPTPAAAAPEPTAPPPATFAGGSNGGGDRQQPASTAAAATAGTTVAPRPPSTGDAPSQALPRVQIRPGAAGPPARPAPASLRRAAGGGATRSRVGRGVAALLTLLVAGGVIAVLLIVTSGGGKNAKTGGTATTNAPAGHKHKTKALNASSVTVAVLNGTATSKLAARISGQLGGDGYKQGPATNAANQTQATTIVAYLPGHRRAAIAVAGSLKLPQSRVQPIDPGTQAIACPQAASCTVQVVVTVGADLATK